MESQRDLGESFPNTFLEIVAFEIRFKPLLIIGEFIPKFQRMVREELPSFTVSVPILAEKYAPQPPGLQQQWIFSSEDNILELKVAVNAVSFLTRKYNTFEEFKSPLNSNFTKFLTTEEINVGTFTRVGLRYRNVISIGLESEDEFFNQEILKFFNPLFDEQIITERNPFRFSSNFRWAKNNNKITVRNNFETHTPKTGRYELDIDVYKDQELESANYQAIIEDLHNLALEIFHDNIKEPFLAILRREP